MCPCHLDVKPCEMMRLIFQVKQTTGFGLVFGQKTFPFSSHVVLTPIDFPP